MTKFLSIITCALCVLVATSCAKDEEVMTGTISGFVSDYSNANSAIAGATVTVNSKGLSKTTGSDGRFEFAELEPGSYSLSISADGYQTATKQVTVYAGQNVNCDVQLNKAALNVSITPQTLSFGPDNDQLSFSIKNNSSRSLQYTISDYPAYISVSPSAATVAAKGTQTVVVKVDRRAISSDVSTSLKVNIGTDSYPVSINVNSQEVAAKMQLTPSTLNFGDSYSELQFTVKNVGTGGDLAWSVSDPTVACFSVSPKTGVTAVGQSTQVTVKLDRSKLTEDITSYINVNTDGGSMSVTVSAKKSSGTGGNGGGNGGNSGEISVTRGLMAYYTFDDETANDSYENEVDGQLYNSPTFTTETPNGRGKAVFLNDTKNQYINIPQNLVKGKTSYSVSMWVKDFGAGLLLCTCPAAKGPSVYVQEDGKLRFVTAWNGDSSNNAYSYDCIPLQSSGWHMITVTLSSSKLTNMYVDGKLVDNTTAHMADSDGTKMQIGGNGDGRWSYSTSMKVDNVRIYSVTLTAEEVEQIYNSER